jgi:hypothetical protein
VGGGDSGALYELVGEGGGGDGVELVDGCEEGGGVGVGDSVVADCVD